MNLLKIIKKIGGGIIKNAVPGGGMLLGAVNEFLPKGSKLGENATGADLGAAVDALPAAERTKLLAKEFDVEIEGLKTIQLMLRSDAKNPQTTRPHIALGCFYVIAFTTIMTVGMWGYAVFTDKAVMVKAIMGGWPFVVAITGTLSTVLLSYFGNLVKEGKNKMDAANGISQPSGIAGLIGSLIKK